MAGAAKIKAGHAFILIEAVDKTSLVIKSVAKRMRNLSRQIGLIGIQTVALGAALLAPFSSAISSGREFSDEILALKAILQATNEVFEKTKTVVRELGRTTSFTATEVAQAATELARGAFQGKQIRDSLKAVLDLARGGRLPLAEAAKIIVQTLSLFNMEASQASEVGDKFFEAARRGVADVRDIATAFSFAANSGNEMGFSLDQMLSILAVMSKRMLIGTKAGTSLNQLFIRLGTEADKLKEKFDIEVATPSGAVKDPIALITEVSKAIKGLPPAERLPAVAEIFNVRGARAALVLKAVDEITDVLDKVIDSSGQAAKAAAIMDSEIGGSIRRIISALQDLKNQVAEALTPTFKELEKFLIPLFKHFSDFIKSNRDAVVKVLALTIGITALGASLIALGGILSLLSFGLGTVNVLLAGLSTFIATVGAPLTALIFGLGAVTAGMIGLTAALLDVNDIGDVINNTTASVENLKKEFKKAEIAIGNLGISGVAAIVPLIQRLNTIKNVMVIGIKGAFEKGIEWVSNFATKSRHIIEVLRENWAGLSASIFFSLRDAFKQSTNIFKVFSKNVISIITSLVSTFQKIFIGLGTFLQKFGKRIQTVPFGGKFNEATKEDMKQFGVTIAEALAEGFNKKLVELPEFDTSRIKNRLGKSVTDITKDLGDKPIQDAIEGFLGIPFEDFARKRFGGALKTIPDLPDTTPALPDELKKVVKDDISVTIPAALQKGTVEAAKKGFENQLMQQQRDLLGGIKKKLDSIEKIEREAARKAEMAPRLAGV